MWCGHPRRQPPAVPKKPAQKLPYYPGLFASTRARAPAPHLGELLCAGPAKLLNR